MADNNALNNSLSGQTGTGSFSGDTSPVLTGNIDFGSATTLKIPNSAAPTISASGDTAVDTTITDFNGLIKYHDGVETCVAVGIPVADLSTTNGDIVTYNSAGSKFTMSTPSAGGSGKIVNYSIVTSSVDDSTSSTSYVDTSLTGSITPTNASNLIFIRAFGYATCYFSSGTAEANRDGDYLIRRTTGSALDLSYARVGRDSEQTSSSLMTSYMPILICAQETAGSTTIHTYRLRHSVTDVDNTIVLEGVICRATMIMYELEV